MNDGVQGLGVPKPESATRAWQQVGGVAHRFESTGRNEHGVADHQRAGTLNDGLETTAAHLVEGGTGRCIWNTRILGRLPGGRLTLACLQDVALQDEVDVLRLRAGALESAPKRYCAQSGCRKGGKRSLKCADGCAGGGDDDDVRGRLVHGASVPGKAARYDVAKVTARHTVSLRGERPIDKVHGVLTGLKKGQIKRLGNLYRRRVAPTSALNSELVRSLATLALELRHPVSVLLDRRGRVVTVAFADADGTPVPPRAGEAEARLRGLRLVHVHPGGGVLSDADLTTLFLSRLDAVIVVEVYGDSGAAPELGPAHLATIAPQSSDDEDWIVDPPTSVQALERDDFAARVRSLEEEMARSASVRSVARTSTERAVLIGLDTSDGSDAHGRRAELAELVRSAGATVAKAEMQVRSRPDPKTLIGRGKLRELVSLAYHEDADLLVFDRELNPAQAREIEEATRLKVLDRTQVILDIFAQNARGREAQVQVELAQLQYSLPRLVGRGARFSRLGGGIGTRGPGETKLEMDRRRIRDRISDLQDEVTQISQQRQRTRRNRTEASTPVVALVGYTNAGKSTLFNALAKSDVLSRDALFATLRPTSREGWLPALGAWGGKVIYTDTVGFIRDLPSELVDAFRATLEELDDADLLLHVVDGASPGAPDRVAAVERILDQLELTPPRRVVINKADAMPANVREDLELRYEACSVSARSGEGLDALKARLAAELEGDKHVPLPEDPHQAWGVVAPDPG